MTTFLSTAPIPQIDIHVVRRDFFDGFTLLLQDADGTPFDLNFVQVCASIWKKPDSGVVSQVTSFNVEKLEPYTNGQVRLWLTSSQTALVWDAASELAQFNTMNSDFFPNAYSAANQGDTSGSSSLVWDARIERQESVSNLISVTSGVFITQLNHTLAASERVVFSGTSVSGINYNRTSARIYSSLTGISYVAPYGFTVSALSGITSNPLGGSVYRLKQDTVAAGNVYVGSTYSNCFP